MAPSKNPARFLLPLIILGGAFIRLLFVFKLNTLFFPLPYTNADTWSYRDSFLNLLHHGSYSFCMLNPEASFGRLPGYPFFWGSIYMLSGPEKVYVAVAIAQALLDTICIYLFYKTLNIIANSRIAGLIGALIYSTYLFIIIWVPVSGTELFASDCCLILVYLVVRYKKPNVLQSIFIGVVVALCFYIREYLGALLGGICLGWLLQKQFTLMYRFRTAIVIGTTFIVLYSLWPIRNYLSFHRVILLKNYSAGYKDYEVDYGAFRNWVFSWSNEVESYTNQIIHTDEPISFPAYIFSDEREKIRTDSLIAMARRGGSGFYYWKHPDRLCSVQAIDSINENAKLVAGFNQLRSSFIQRQPVTFYVKIPLSNLKKEFFKSSTVNNKTGMGTKGLFIKLLFGYRTLLVILGFIGLFFLPDKLAKWTVGFYVIFIYLFIAFILRQTEMRYLLQADVLLLIPAAYVLYLLFNRIFVHRAGLAVAGMNKNIN